MSEKPVILITGASLGIGAATARVFGAHGYRVVLAARSRTKLDELAAEIQSQGGEAFAVQTDVTRLEDIQNMVRLALEKYGQIDILFNNAGIGRLDWLERLDPVKDIQPLLQANLTGLIWTSRAVLPHMIERGQGHIINMASVSGLISTPMYSIYSASKFGVRGFTDALRREAGVKGIRVSGIYPGGVATDFAREDMARRKTGFRTPRWLVLSPEDVAHAVYGLARRPRRMVVIPWIMRVAYWLSLIFPGLVDWVIEARFVRPEQK